jgi:hypothetical protein
MDYDDFNESLYPEKHNRLFTNNMPIEPVNPTKFENRVVEKLIEYNNAVTTPMREQIQNICKLFNFCIEKNKDGSISNSRYVYPAQTGSGKSLSLKTYLTMLEKHSSLIIVSRVDEAIEYCKFINEVSGDKNYAKCYYKKNDENPDTEYRVNLKDLKKYRAIVISHTMFKLLNQDKFLSGRITIDDFRLYKNKQRDLVVIDERIHLFDKYEITKKELDYLVLGFYQMASSLGFMNIKNLGEDLVKLQQYFKWFEEYSSGSYIRSFEFNDNELQAEIKETIGNIKEELVLVTKEYTKLVNGTIKLITSKNIKRIQEDLLNNYETLINKLEKIFDNDFLFYKNNQGENLLYIEDYSNKLGCTLVLDATASINEFYKTAYKYGSKLYEVNVKPIRKYKNLTINLAEGYLQSRTQLFKNLSEEEIADNAKMYMSYINNILKSNDDKLLVYLLSPIENID